MGKRRRGRMPAYKTLLSWAKPKSEGVECRHELKVPVFQVLHHDHLVNFALDKLHDRYDARDLSVKWQSLLLQLKHVVMDPVWICNKCNEQDGALKADWYKAEPWFVEQYMSLPHSCLTELFEEKEAAGLKAMRAKASALVATERKRHDATKSEIEALIKSL